ncbi:MAG: protein kinase, partial [Myxococcales bacterium]|nr:protein kinase [Myxococcales bacterium]
ALKLIQGARDDRERRARLQREARAMAKLAHPNVVQVFEVGEREGLVFIAMECVEGEDLRAWMDRAGRSWREVIEVFLQAGRGLAAAHAAGLVHRDFKPEPGGARKKLSKRINSGREFRGSVVVPAPTTASPPTSPGPRSRRRGCSAPGACRPASLGASRGRRASGVSATRPR